jgi:hypothetical protein
MNSWIGSGSVSRKKWRSSDDVRRNDTREKRAPTMTARAEALSTKRTLDLWKRTFFRKAQDSKSRTLTCKGREEMLVCTPPIGSFTALARFAKRWSPGIHRIPTSR